jgi:hypothetical protein
MLLTRGESELAQFEAALALTNLASMDDGTPPYALARHSPPHDRCVFALRYAPTGMRRRRRQT